MNLDIDRSICFTSGMPSNQPSPRYEVAKFGTKWGIVFRLDARTSFDQHVRYKTRREAQGFCAAINRAEGYGQKEAQQ